MGTEGTEGAGVAPGAPVAMSSDAYGCIIAGNELGQVQVIRRAGVAVTNGEKASPNKDAPAPGQLAWRTVQTWGEADRRAGVTCMDVVSDGVSGAGAGGHAAGTMAERALVLVGRKHGGIDMVWVDRVSGMLDTATVRRIGCAGGEQSAYTQDDGVSISAVHGLILPRGADGHDTGTDQGQQRWGDGMLVCAVARNGSVTFYDSELENVGSFSCPPQVTCAAYHAASRQLAICCEGAELKVYTLSWEEIDDVNTSNTSKISKSGGTSGPLRQGLGRVTGTLSYSAKGGKPDKVGFCDKPWNSAIAFNPLVEDGSQIIVATGHGKLRLYDTTIGRRPQLNVPFKERRITSISPDRREKIWWIADAEGNMQSYDVAMGKFIGAMKGMTGSIRATAIHPTEPCIVSGGLDRYVRVHSTRTRVLMMRLYMTSQLCVVKWLGVTTAVDTITTDEVVESTASEPKKKAKKRKTGA